MTKGTAFASPRGDSRSHPAVSVTATVDHKEQYKDSVRLSSQVNVMWIVRVEREDQEKKQ